MSTHFFGQVTQKALIEKDGKFLLVRPPDERNPLAAGKWDMPGGRLSEGEHPIEGLKREVFEEIGVMVAVGDAVGFDVFVNLSQKPSYLTVFRAELIEPTAPLVLQRDEVAEARWFTPEDIVDAPFVYEAHKAIVTSFISQRNHTL